MLAPDADPLPPHPALNALENLAQRKPRYAIEAARLRATLPGAVPERMVHNVVSDPKLLSDLLSKQVNLANDPRNGSAVPAEASIAASATCARSGAFALLLSLALFTMIPYWQHRAEQIALANYVALRLSLAGAVETLNGSVNWKTYRVLNPEADLMTIAQLLKVQVTGTPVPQGTPTGKKEATVSGGSVAVPRGAPGYRPAPPTNLQLSITSTIDEMQPIVDLLVKLDDSQLLTKSRNVSIFYNYSIFRWAIKRNTLLMRNVGPTSGGVVWQAQPDPNAPDNFVPSWGKEPVLNNLTMEGVRELASFELPQLSDTTSIGVTGEKEIDISPGSLPRTLFAATLCAECLLLFVIIHLGAFAREATSSELFPVAGTLFSAFAKSSGTLFVFGVALCVPLIASLGILLVSRKWEFLLLTALIGCAIYWIFCVLQRKRYFGEFGWILAELGEFYSRRAKRLGPWSKQNACDICKGGR